MIPGLVMFFFDFWITTWIVNKSPWFCRCQIMHGIWIYSLFSKDLEQNCQLHGQCPTRGSTCVNGLFGAPHRKHCRLPAIKFAQTDHTHVGSFVRYIVSRFNCSSRSWGKFAKTRKTAVYPLINDDECNQLARAQPLSLEVRREGIQPF